MSAIVVTTNLTNNTLGISRQKSASITTTGDNHDYRHVTITQAGEFTFTIDSEVGNAGYCNIVNNDATNFIKVGFGTGDYKMRVLPGAPMCVQLDPAVSALYFIADTADCKADIWVAEA